MPAGARPGERRGGRAKGTKNKVKSAAMAVSAAERKAAEAAVAVDPLVGRSIPNMRKVSNHLMGMAAKEQQSDKPNHRWIKELLEAAAKIDGAIAPYEFRRLATLEPAMETVIKPDGSVHVTITKTDAEL